MTFKQTVLAAVSASGILLSVSTIAPATFSMTTQAQADTSISVNIGFGTFYDRLEPYGNWVSYQDQYVFIPQHVHHGWRPYTLGHWSYTHRYGWLWVSDERFGWATYHYGRWGYSRDIGWYWVPGRRWAPAWVAWSHGQNEVAWAPLPPQRGGDLDVSITIGDVPDYYWQAVPTSAFLSINLSDRIIRDRNQVRTIVQQSPPETVHIENNIVINNVIQVNQIEKATNTKVMALTEKPVSNPDAVGKTDNNTVAIFNPEVKVDASAKPKKALQVDQVITDRKAQGIQTLDVPADQPIVPGQTLDKTVQPAMPAVQPAAKAQVPADGKTTTDVPVVKPDQPVIDPLKPADSGGAKVDVQGKAVVTPPADAAKSSTDVPVTKQKAGDAAVPQDTQKIDQPKQIGQQPKDQNAKDKKPKDAKDKVKCDPNVETCPPAQ